MAEPIRGTREWAVDVVDCCVGCSHDCKYCYARYDAVHKKGEVKESSWKKPVVLPERVNRDYGRYSGQVMFPAHHDIQPENLAECLTVLKRLLGAGNRVLVVSKPHLACVTKICLDLQQYRDQLLFRFTITARDNRILRFWEPGAPLIEERLASLAYVYENGFRSSVSIEPMLESESVIQLVAELTPLVSHSIWIGKMNRIEQRVDMTIPGMLQEVERIVAGQSDERIRRIYRELADNPLIRWKESIKETVGIELVKEAGLDI